MIRFCEWFCRILLLHGLNEGHIWQGMLLYALEEQVLMQLPYGCYICSVWP